MSKEKRLRQAFIDEVREVERKHGYRLLYYQPPVQAVIKPIVPEVSKEAAEMVEKIARGESPAQVQIPWYKRLFSNRKVV